MQGLICLVICLINVLTTCVNLLVTTLKNPSVAYTEDEPALTGIHCVEQDRGQQVVYAT